MACNHPLGREDCRNCYPMLQHILKEPVLMKCVADCNISDKFLRTLSAQDCSKYFQAQGGYIAPVVAAERMVTSHDRRFLKVSYGPRFLPLPDARAGSQSKDQKHTDHRFILRFDQSCNNERRTLTSISSYHPRMHQATDLGIVRQGTPGHGCKTAIR